jgi:3-oxoacyl-[acyl-carrier-protein] synthase II
MALSEVNHNPPARRVVITGMGVVAPNGCDLSTFWDSIIRGDTAAGPITRFNTDDLPTKIACEVKGFDPRRYMDTKLAKRMELCAQFGIAASTHALADSRINIHQLDPDRVAVIEGNYGSGFEGSIREIPSFNAKGYRSISPFSLMNYSGSGSGEIAHHLGFKGHAITLSTGCASGNDAIGYGMRVIRDGEMDVALAGGTEAALMKPVFGAYCQNRMMTTQNSNPRTAMKPLDKNRDGFILGEGAAFLVLEELTHALSRGANIYAEIAGHGRSCDAYHSVAPHPDGIGMIRAMEKALCMAGIHCSEVNYINIHGTATHKNDLAELAAFKVFLKDCAHRVALSSTKPVTGHLLGASGALESVVCVLALRHGMIPHTLNLSEPEEGYEGDLVMGSSRSYPLNVVMNLNSGFGGKNACLVLRKYLPTS